MLWAIVFCIFKIKSQFTWLFKSNETIEDINSMVENLGIKWVKTWFIQESFSWTINEVKWYAEGYYQDVMKDYVDKAKEWISWAVENAKWYYNQWIDDLWDTITNEINNKVVEWLDKIKVK